MDRRALLQKPLHYLDGISYSRAELLAKELDLHTLNDLLHFFPNRYVDRSKFYKINELHMATAEVQLYGKIMDYEEVGYGKKKRLVAVFSDGTGTLELVWFRNYQWVKEQYPVGVPLVVSGRLNWFGRKPNMPHPEIDRPENFKRHGHLGLMPVYPSTEKLVKKGITNRVMRKFVKQLFELTGTEFPETLPGYIRKEYNLVSRAQALGDIHFPKNLSRLAEAQYRLKFEELFFLQLQLVYIHRVNKKKIKGHIFDKIGDYVNRFYKEVLPFDLTDAQKRVVREIRRDVRSGAQMNRLLQGDVGSGKTVVAMMSMLMALDNGYQAAMLVPTEILAQQHYLNIKKWARPLSIRVSLLTGSTKQSERKDIHEGLLDGSIHILVGTHAILEDRVQFANLGLAVIDEQHRFGVAQRAKMWQKNKIPPHILIMTATPIPRTLAMTQYGDLDISIIDELPPGRKPVKTIHVYPDKRPSVYEFIRNEVKTGRQAYIVYPLIEESSKLDYESLMEGFERVKNEFLYDDIRIDMVHGMMKPADKEFVMQKFKNKQVDILVSTTVIEVGVDVPNANIMLIESAERFGLSQLHQLRGRVGRGSDKAYCILMTDYKLSEEAKTRIKTMVETNDGFKIAEVDMQLRGPGNIMGTQQSGIIRLKLADYVKDTYLMQQTRRLARKIIAADPDLSKPENAVLKEVLAGSLRKNGYWNYIG